METAFALFDRLFFGHVLKLPDEVDIATINRAAHDEQDQDQGRYRDFIYDMMSAVDAKVSALLTHISLIIAALVFIYSSRAAASASVFLKNLIMCEIVAYLLADSVLSQVRSDDDEAFERQRCGGKRRVGD